MKKISLIYNKQKHNFKIIRLKKSKFLIKKIMKKQIWFKSLLIYKKKCFKKVKLYNCQIKKFLFNI